MNKFLILICSFLLSSCGAGGNNTAITDLPDHPSIADTYLQFSQNVILMQVGSIQAVNLSLIGSGYGLSSYNFGLYSSESGIVSINPNICNLNGQSPPSCVINIIALKAGTTTVRYDIDFPGQPLVVAVVSSHV